MYTLEGFDNEYVKKIYQNTVLYSIYKYNELDYVVQQMFSKRFTQAKKAMNDLGISSISPSKYEIQVFLEEQKQKMEEIRKQNQPIIDQIADASVKILLDKMPSDLDNIGKLQYIFDFVTKTMTLSNDWFNYCANVPPIDGYDFEFYKGVPTSNSYAGLIVTRTGNSDDITNLIIYLANRIGINVEKRYAKFNDKRIAVNCISVSDTTVSYLDPCAVISGRKKKEDSFLVSVNKLDYRFKDDEPSVTFEREKTTYDMDEIINQINKLLPEINYLSYNKLAK